MLNSWRGSAVVGKSYVGTGRHKYGRKSIVDTEKKRMINDTAVMHARRNAFAPRREHMKLLLRREERSLEEILIDEILGGTGNGRRCGPGIHEILYSASPAMNELGYGRGFYIGGVLYSRGGRHGIRVLDTMLARAGMGGLLYYPFREFAVVKSTSPARAFPAGPGLHSYEAGVIAGYFSASTSRMMSAEESECRYGGGTACRFEIKRVTAERHSSECSSPYELVGAAAASVMACGDGCSADEEYSILSVMPLLRSEALEGASGLSFAVGSKLAEMAGENDWETVIDSAARFFGLKHGKVIKGVGNKKSSVLLRYGPCNSDEAFVDISSAMFVGFLSKAFGSKVRMRKWLDAKGRYAVRLTTQNQ